LVQPKDARLLLEAARDERSRTLILFALHTGVRMGEQRALRWTDIDLERRIISIRRSAPKWLSIEKTPKSNRHRRVDLTEELAEALERLPRERDLVFCNPDGSKLQPGQFHEVLWLHRRGPVFVGSSGTSSGTRSRRSSRRPVLLSVSQSMNTRGIDGGNIAMYEHSAWSLWPHLRGAARQS
jgi:integrase